MTAAQYDFGMTTRITVSLPDQAVAAAKKAVKDGGAASVSAYVAAALAHTYGEHPGAHEEERPLVKLLAELKAEYGEPSAEAYRWAEEALGIA
jgi:Arc/MetJ-type ribon-helix-helix transcriptional regulator